MIVKNLSGNAVPVRGVVKLWQPAFLIFVCYAVGSTDGTNVFILQYQKIMKKGMLTEQFKKLGWIKKLDSITKVTRINHLRTSMLTSY